MEIDTWHNLFNGDTELHSDPTSQNHIEITLDGDPGNSVAWALAPNIEDYQWHTITVQVTGAQVVVSLDGDEIINQVVPGLQFRGGFIGFSGSTGFYTNHHEFDDLQILDDCDSN